MQTVLIVIHFLVVITLVGVILIQHSEGGGLGVSSGSGLMKTRGSKNALSRLTAILACCFFAVSIGLTVVGSISNSSSDILKRIPVHSEQNSTNKGTSEVAPSSKSEAEPSILEELGGGSVPPQEQNQSKDHPATENPVPPILENPVPGNDAK
ncbi:preprotein translocase subunit SecG [Bartonella henselae]|uniref:Protein-export membrane protein SecG n=2 Tax=Bartonella henselae TaxID=38323 RepID=X5MF38_BARHN|nr:preprotein translocase subunit SecG [Bartonella henselae]ATP12170.1 preprotein translocase subunit SecG [Bartonella henselae]ETS07963.1 preprotein translocase, SecG subunit [Bartonella henselae JK 42]ETS09868.1 preprotein translocase, SecG subunit [Bartonella henselae JK 50]ETS10378.1 preprotein translocase, SecG subunit [Bartonella henselae JK 51]ETS12381.1 preprotein translocase, SecG subunit [Bartonella henselae JK 41]